MTKEDADALNQALKVAMAGRGGLITRSVIVVEFVDDTGERGLTCIASDDVRTWEVLGMLEYTTELCRMSITGGSARSVDDDDE
jgi:hypothetical protein